MKRDTMEWDTMLRRTFVTIHTLVSDLGVLQLPGDERKLLWQRLASWI